MDDGETEGWIGRAVRLTYVDCGGSRGGGRALVTVGVLKYPLQTSVGTRDDDTIEITGLAGDQADETV